MYHVVEETTDWNTPNHIYFLNERRNKMYAYINALTGESKIFSKPLTFDERNREFQLIAKYK